MTPCYKQSSIVHEVVIKIKSTNSNIVNLSLFVIDGRPLTRWLLFARHVQVLSSSLLVCKFMLLKLQTMMSAKTKCINSN